MWLGFHGCLDLNQSQASFAIAFSCVEQNSLQLSNRVLTGQEVKEVRQKKAISMSVMGFSNACHIIWPWSATPYIAQQNDIQHMGIMKTQKKPHIYMENN